MRTQTRIMFGKRLAAGCGVAALALTLGLGSIADGTAAFGRRDLGLEVGPTRQAARPAAVRHHPTATSASRWAGGALSNRR
ncbi:MAG: hypothetical protein QOF33_3885 [Thermomicrobiales bacterium]|nr:hypothetical protein [Thermomicrobiales bacterium]